MEKAEKAVLIKIIEGLSVSDSDTTENETVEELYLKDPDEYINSLRERNNRFSDKSDFSDGDIVVWKDGLRNKRLPEYKQPAIIIKTIAPPIIDKENSYDEELDIHLGFITEDNEFLSYSYDSRRFELFKK